MQPTTGKRDALFEQIEFAPFGTGQEIVAPCRMRYANARLPERNPAIQEMVRLACL